MTSSGIRRIAFIAVIAAGVGLLGALSAEILIRLIGGITNLAFYGRLSLSFIEPADNHLGPWVIVVPVIGGLIVGVMARYGSAAIRGHGIPEVMEGVLEHDSKIPARVSLLKPVSAAIAIGTGGPFGAEGPIIATGGALGSLVGQFLRISADERKVLLAAGAAAGMTATFGTPVSAVLLAVELLLFEYRPRSLIPVALASAVATAARIAFRGDVPVFAMPTITPPGGWALLGYCVLGAICGLASGGITRALYAFEDVFVRSRVHWMWWPAIGALAVGIIGWAVPRTLGVGYNNIDDLLSGTLAGRVLLILVVMKLLSWLISLGSGTSGGTLAPLFTIGGGLGAVLGDAAATWIPSLGIDPHMAGLVGMAATFAGASHAVLASVVFAFETTWQPIGLLPLLAGCSTAYLVSLATSRTSIMTERLARRGQKVEAEYAMDYLSLLPVRKIMTAKPVTLSSDRAVQDVIDEMAANHPGMEHQGFPVLDDQDRLIGVVTRRDLLSPDASFTARVGDIIRRKPVIISEDTNGREALELMVREDVGRLCVVRRRSKDRLIGLITRTDLLRAHRRRLEAAERRVRMIRYRRSTEEPEI